jgi:hypothetical protein
MRLLRKYSSIAERFFDLLRASSSSDESDGVDDVSCANHGRLSRVEIRQLVA